MKASLLFSCFLILWLCWDSVESAPQTFDFLRQAYEGAKDMYRAYKDKKDANWRGADKYFQARGNYDAAKRGPGGAWIAEKLSKVRAIWKENVIGRSVKDNMAEQIASKWGRNGKDPNVFRPPGLPEKY